MFSANTSQVSNDVKYIEDFFSAWLRTGTGSSQTVTTGIKENTGALVISKSRSAATDWAWYDTFRGATKDIASNTTAAETTQSQGLTSFNTDGHTWGTLAKVNTSGATYVDFVLKPTPKFFDVVTYTGDGTTSKTINHNLGSVPGCIIVKPVTLTGGWLTYHRSLGNTKGLYLNTTAASATSSGFWNNTDPTSTQFTVGSTSNDSGQTFVAYLFAHNAGGFGLTGTDNVISCGSYTTNGSGVGSVNLGYEPQWVLFKPNANGDSWVILDTMRGWTADGTTFSLYPNTASSEAGPGAGNVSVNATGFYDPGMFGTNTQILYIAIRRGPMKTPTSGTSVFSPFWQGGSSITNPITTGFPVDMAITTQTNTYSKWFFDRLRSNSTTSYATITSTSTAAETTGSGAGISFQSNTGIVDQWIQDSRGVYWNFKRAPSFFDVVCYTGTGSATTVTHNLGVAPELMIFKSRSAAGAWPTFSALTSTSFNSGELNSTIAFTPSGYSSGGELSAAPTSTTFSLGGSSPNNSGTTYVAYLFASCPGVSKCGSYTGTGTTQQINCGFTAGARFVLIKRTDSTGDWYVWDTARGIVAGNDPYLLLNSTAAEVTSTDYVDSYSAGFEISSTAPAAINASGGSFIYLAIA